MTRHLNAFTASFALHLCLVAALIWLSAEAGRRGALVATAAAEPTELAAPSLFDPAAPRRPSPASRHDDDLQVPNATGSTELDIPNFSFDFGKIASRASSLFPFLTHDFAFEPLKEMAAQATRRGLVNPYSRVPEAARQPALVMNDRTMQALVDRIWSRRERWGPFHEIAELTARYNANDGQLPMLLRRYSEYNLLQPYVETHVRDPRLWTMLGIAADHSDFVGFITQYATAHPSTKATTELLFMLDDMAQGSRDTLLALLDIDSHKDLWWTRTKNEDAHGLVIVLQKYYREKLERRGIATPEGTTFHYDSVRLGILAIIVTSTPAEYRADDARFLIGAIYWRNDRREDAIRWWREMRVDKSNRYAAAAAAIHTAIDGAAWQQVDARAITEVLDAERRRWTEFWWGRLQKFGYSYSAY